ncbi:MAG: DUF2243 domain-containing protein [Bradyrhizobium sp.]|uniref:DUF2243 domain-containing protein n=1 Tax=Bradyrhizobium sp. TaxID=376 RepID=UPI0025C22A53|nr:DUF2243 domain-containing protein [Bradyrhizobium sp.]MBI5261612.1 DUF2243 domain-containing protein [Bradyrhizobium sp.]
MARADPAKRESEVRDGVSPRFLFAACLLLGLGLGGFFDGIVFHQLLQWHHMVSGWYPLNSIENIELNTTWDGIFHSFAYVLVLAGVFLLWRSARQGRLLWSNRSFIAMLLAGWGIFNVVEGLADHQILGLHRVNETVPANERLYWDLGFLIWGAAMLALGWAMANLGERESADAESL